MKKHLHRIVFNAARGMRMVVQETACSTVCVIPITPVICCVRDKSLHPICRALCPNSSVHAERWRLAKWRTSREMRDALKGGKTVKVKIDACPGQRQLHDNDHENNSMKTSRKTRAISNNAQNRLKPEVDGLVLDFRNLSAENQRLLTDHVLNDFSPAEQTGILILHGEDQKLARGTSSNSVETPGPVPDLQTESEIEI